MITPAIIQIGLDHWCAPSYLFDRLHATRTVPDRGGTAGIVALATCQRLELYVEGAGAQRAEELFRSWLRADAETERQAAACRVLRSGEAAARHLVRTSAGLESVVLGEDQILTQVRRAYRDACASRSTGPLLHRLFHAAFRAGRRVRAETDLGRGTRSLAGEAVSFLAHALSDLEKRSVLVVGTGEMGQTAVRLLRERRVGRLLVAGRSWERSQELAGTAGGEAWPLAWLREALADVSGVVAASGSPEPVIGPDWCEEACRKSGRLVIVDLGMPRNVVAPAPIPPGLLLADLDALSQRISETRGRSAGAVKAAERIVEDELRDWMNWVVERGLLQEGISPGLRAGREIRACSQ
jgi:glutamyl-tRNA reductase